MWILYLVLLVVVISVSYAAASGAPWVPTWKKDLVRIEKLLDLQEGDKFIELGSGNGRVCRHLASTSKAEVSGLELSILQHVVSFLQNKITRSKALSLFGNVFNHDLGKYSAIYLFLMPETYEKIRPKFEAELRPGTKVVSYVWPIPGWEAERVDVQEGSSNLYLYII